MIDSRCYTSHFEAFLAFAKRKLSITIGNNSTTPASTAADQHPAITSSASSLDSVVTDSSIFVALVQYLPLPVFADQFSAASQQSSPMVTTYDDLHPVEPENPQPTPNPTITPSSDQLSSSPALTQSSSISTTPPRENKHSRSSPDDSPKPHNSPKRYNVMDEVWWSTQFTSTEFEHA
jgi:hypothetical protein